MPEYKIRMRFLIKGVGRSLWQWKANRWVVTSLHYVGKTSELDLDRLVFAETD